MSSTLHRLSRWYRAQCDGDWEHTFGVKLETLDNPGWIVKVDLANTRLAEVAFPGIAVGDPESPGWMNCRKADAVFEAACAPELLEDVLKIFLEWAEPHAAG